MRRDDDLRIERMLIRAHGRCKQRDARLTAQRAAILKLLLRRRRPTTAYELRAGLGRLQHRSVSPITIYRALEFLVQQGLVAHLARRNAYVACEHVERDHAHLVFVCTACGAATERADRTTERRVAHAAREIGFVPDPVTIEIDGLCEDCQVHPSQGTHADIRP
jgi:Fur family zinc uptake transcriptional regulator